MNKKPEIPHRRSLRLKEYDYTQPGAYFITIVTQNRSLLFGNIIDGEMHLNDAGKMINTAWYEIPFFYPGVEIDAFQIMPNHIHGIIILSNSVGVGPRAYPPDPSQNRAGTWRAYPFTKPGQPQGVAPTKPLSLPDVAHRFKSLTTHRYMDGVKHHQWTAFEARLWQRNYYEHIIRDDNDYESIVDYILANSFNWEKDEENITSSGS